MRGVVWEDVLLFASEVNPECSQSSRQALGPIMDLWSKWLGDQWSIGDWSGVQAAAPLEIPFRMVIANEGMQVKRAGEDATQASEGPPQNFKEYDRSGPVLSLRARRCQVAITHACWRVFEYQFSSPTISVSLR